MERDGKQIFEHFLKQLCSADSFRHRAGRQWPVRFYISRKHALYVMLSMLANILDSKLDLQRRSEHSTCFYHADLRQRVDAGSMVALSADKTSLAQKARQRLAEPRLAERR